LAALQQWAQRLSAQWGLHPQRTLPLHHRVTGCECRRMAQGWAAAGFAAPPPPDSFHNNRLAA